MKHQTVRSTRITRTSLLDRFMRAQPALQARLSERMPEEVRAELGAATLHQLRALLTIHERGSVTMRELSESLRATSLSAATQMGDRLARPGLVERIHDEQDRRVVRLTLTPRAQDLLDRALAIRREALTEVLACLDRTELETLVVLTERVAGSLTPEGDIA